MGSIVATTAAAREPAAAAGWDWVPGTFGPLDLSIVFSLRALAEAAALLRAAF